MPLCVKNRAKKPFVFYEKRSSAKGSPRRMLGSNSTFNLIQTFFDLLYTFRPNATRLDSTAPALVQRESGQEIG